MKRHKWQYLICTALFIVASLATMNKATPTQAAAPAASGTDTTWQTESVHPSVELSNMGARSLALDTSGRPHVAFGGHHLYYAHQTERGWQVTLVDPADQVGQYTSLALDAQGYPHISYLDRANEDLKYAHYDGQTWRIERIDSASQVRGCTSLDLDPQDRPQISYFDAGQGALKLAWYRDGTWHSGAIEGVSGQYICSALVLDDQGRPHLSYSGSAGLKYAYIESTAQGDRWNIQFVDESPYVGVPTSLALDGQSRPHIAYCHRGYLGACAVLRYAHHDGNLWRHDLVDTGYRGGAFPSLALDSNPPEGPARPHISYYNGSGDALKYARYDGPEQGWHSQVVKSGGYYTSLAIDPAGRPRISYYNARDNALEYAYAVPPDFADPAFEALWKRSDLPVSEGMVARSWMWGERPLTQAAFEPYADSPGGSRLVQYFDKARMEINDPGGDRGSKWFVTNGLLVREMVEGWVQLGDHVVEAHAPAEEAVAGDPSAVNPACPVYASFNGLTWPRAVDRTGQVVTATLSRDGVVGDDPALAAYGESEVAYYEGVTGHNVPGVLWAFMHQRGPVYENGGYGTGQLVDWLFAMGYPISEPYWVRCRVAGEEKDVLVQLFERRVLTYTPSNPEGWRVEMGNVGLHYYTWRYGIEP